MVWRRAVLIEGKNGKNSEIYVKNLETGEERNISNHEAYYSNPHWRDLIVFASNRNGANNLYTMKPDSSALTIIIQTKVKALALVSVLFHLMVGKLLLIDTLKVLETWY